MKNVLLIHGDFHGVAGPAAGKHRPAGSRSSARRRCGRPAPRPRRGHIHRYYNNAGGECRQYGRVTVTDNGGQTITVAFQGWDAVNQVAQVSQTFVANVACGFRPLPGII